VTHIGGGSGNSAQLDAMLGEHRFADDCANHSLAKGFVFRDVTVHHQAGRGWNPEHHHGTEARVSERRWRGLPSAEFAPGH